MTITRAFLRAWAGAVAAFVLVPAVPLVNAQSPKHPIDGLTPTEIWSAYEVL